MSEQLCVGLCAIGRRDCLKLSVLLAEPTDLSLQRQTETGEKNVGLFAQIAFVQCSVEDDVMLYDGICSSGGIGVDLCDEDVPGGGDWYELVASEIGL